MNMLITALVSTALVALLTGALSVLAVLAIEFSVTFGMKQDKWTHQDRRRLEVLSKSRVTQKLSREEAMEFDLLELKRRQQL